MMFPPLQTATLLQLLQMLQQWPAVPAVEQCCYQEGRSHFYKLSKQTKIYVADEYQQDEYQQDLMAG